MTAVLTAADPRSSILRRNRPFLLLWVGQALSGFGSSMTVVALPLALLTAGHALAAVAAVGTAATVTGLAARIPAGFVADLREQRGLLIGCDLVRLANAAAVAFYVAVRPLSLWLAFGTVVVSGLASEVFKPAQFRLLLQVVDAEQVPSAISLNQARTYAAQLAGPAAAGLLISAHPEVPFAVDALTFLASAVCIAAIKPSARGDAYKSPAQQRAEPQPPFWSRLTAGLRYVAHDPFLRRSTAFFSGLTLLFAMFDTALILGVGREHGGAANVGWALSTAALAGLLGSLAAPRLQRWLSLPRLVASGPALAAALLMVTWLTGGTLAFAAAFSAMCLLVPAINASVIAAIAATTPEGIFGRVAAANDFAVQLLQPFAPMVAAVLLVGTALSTTAVVLAAGFALLALVALALPTPRPNVLPPNEPLPNVPLRTETPRSES